MLLPNEWNDFLDKFSGAIISTLLAIIGKISNEVLMKRQLSWFSWMAILGVCLFWAWMAGLYCAWQGYGNSGTSIIVGLATLMGEKINIYISQNYKAIIEKVLSIFTSKK